jgi:putative ABC transport system permease protein
MGATVPGMVTMLNKDVTKLVVIGCVLAIPFAWWISNKWLESFAFRIGLSWWIFVGASVAAILIAWITVSWQSIRAASLDPVKTLRYE